MFRYVQVHLTVFKIVKQFRKLNIRNVIHDHVGLLQNIRFVEKDDVHFLPNICNIRNIFACYRTSELSIKLPKKDNFHILPNIGNVWTISTRNMAPGSAKVWKNLGNLFITKSHWGQKRIKVSEDEKDILRKRKVISPFLSAPAMRRRKRA